MSQIADTGFISDPGPQSTVALKGYAGGLSSLVAYLNSDRLFTA